MLSARQQESADGERAGSGKTTFMQRVNSYLHSRNQPPYILNLDPAVTHLPFTANIDIRDTVDYHEVMKQLRCCRSLATIVIKLMRIGQVQPRPERRDPDRAQPLHDKVRPGAHPRREARDDGRVCSSSNCPSSQRRRG